MASLTQTKPTDEQGCSLVVSAGDGHKMVVRDSAGDYWFDPCRDCDADGVISAGTHRQRYIQEGEHSFVYRCYYHAVMSKSTPGHTVDNDPVAVQRANTMYVETGAA